MNEHLVEIAEQCYHRYSENNVDLKKFARMIVLRCISELEISKSCDPYTGQLIECEKNVILDEQIEWLRNYFGVDDEQQN